MSGRMNVPVGQQMRFAKGPVMKKTTPKAILPNTLLVDHNLRLALPGWSPSLLVAFRLIILMRFFAGMYTGISDCDEVYNYWEPLHYIWRGKGFQTWEYSPDYAIRSYFYLLVNSFPGFVAQYFPNKRVAFFALRLTLGTISSYVEAVLYRAVATQLSPHIGRYLLWSLVFSAAFYNCATSFLPSTFAMWGVMLGTAASLAPVDGGRKRIVLSGLGFASAAIVGWPFAALLAVPAVLEQLFVRGTKEKVTKGQEAGWAARRAGNLAVALAVGASLLIPVVYVDSKAYQRLAVVPLNIIKYNIFPQPGGGPDLYGTESPTFYFRNALLGFNILLPLAFLSLPAVLVTSIIDPKRFGDQRDRVPGQTSPAFSLAIRLSPMYLWFAVLSYQSHKEERFLFPAYGYVLLNAATTLYLTRCWLEQAFLKWTKSPYRLTQSSVFSNYTRTIMVITCLLSFGRISAMYNYYHASMDVYSHFQSYELPRLALKTFPALYPSARGIDVSLPFANFSLALDESDHIVELDPLDALNLRLCLGKEWHRFPSHYLVPDQVEVRFIKSAFEGILPKLWEDGVGKGGLLGRATGVVPSGMNSLNKEEADRYVDVTSCHYLIDSDFPLRTTIPHPAEPRYAVDSATWERVFCAPFLDNQNSAALTRAFNLPIPTWQSHNQFGDYCLLRNRSLL